MLHIKDNVLRFSGRIDIHGNEIREGYIIARCYGAEYSNELHKDTWKRCGCTELVYWDEVHVGGSFAGFRSKKLSGSDHTWVVKDDKGEPKKDKDGKVITWAYSCGHLYEIIGVDPNYRPMLWDGRQYLKPAATKEETLVNTFRAQKLLIDPYTWRYKIRNEDFLGQILKKVYV